jgi:hypothetical protein
MGNDAKEVIARARLFAYAQTDNATGFLTADSSILENRRSTHIFADRGHHYFVILTGCNVIIHIKRPQIGRTCFAPGSVGSGRARGAGRSNFAAHALGSRWPLRSGLTLGSRWAGRSGRTRRALRPGRPLRPSDALWTSWTGRPGRARTSVAPNQKENE